MKNMRDRTKEIVCWYCPLPELGVSIEIAHIYPKVKIRHDKELGKQELFNLAFSCRKCKAAKHEAGSFIRFNEQEATQYITSIRKLIELHSGISLLKHADDHMSKLENYCLRISY